MEGWPGERWLDIRHHDVLEPILRERIQECAAKGFDGVDPDNVAGYGHDTGFDLTEEDTVAYLRLLAGLAHDAGLAVGVKNAPEVADEVATIVDFGVVEQCLEHAECKAYRPLLDAGLAVVDIEYAGEPGEVCERAPAGMDVLWSVRELDRPAVVCGR